MSSTQKTKTMFYCIQKSPDDSSPQPISVPAVKLGLLQAQEKIPINFPACPHVLKKSKLNEKKGASKIKRKAVVFDQNEANPSSPRTG